MNYDNKHLYMHSDVSGGCIKLIERSNAPYPEFYQIIKDTLIKNNLFYNESDVYHYTNLDGLYGLISDNKIWFSDRNCMNDIYDEKFIKEKAKGFNIDISDMFNDKGDKKGFIFSTSIEEDSIHQWTYYGNNESFCIVFDREKLINDFIGTFCEYKGYYYGKILYDDSTIDKFITGLNEIVSILQDNKKKDFRTNIYKKVFQYFYSLCKQNGHRCEQEYRFVIYRKYDKSVKFRKGNKIIIPYIEVGHKRNEMLLPIKKIICGPNSRTIPYLKESLNVFLNRNGYKDVDISYSEMYIR